VNKWKGLIGVSYALLTPKVCAMTNFYMVPAEKFFWLSRSRQCPKSLNMLYAAIECVDAVFFFVF